MRGFLFESGLRGPLSAADRAYTGPANIRLLSVVKDPGRELTATDLAGGLSPPGHFTREV